MLYPRRCLFKDCLYRRSVETLKRGVFLKSGFIKKFENAVKVRMPVSRKSPVGICDMDVFDLRSDLCNGLSKISVLDIRMKQIPQNPNTIRISKIVYDEIIYLVAAVQEDRLIAVDRLQNDNDPFFLGIIGYGKHRFPQLCAISVCIMRAPEPSHQAEGDLGTEYRCGINVLVKALLRPLYNVIRNSAQTEPLETSGLLRAWNSRDLSDPSLL